VLGYPDRHGGESSFFAMCDAPGGTLLTGETVVIDRSVGPRRPRLVLSATHLHLR
jgi:hypothetical protein